MSNSTSKVSTSKSQHIDVALLDPKELNPSDGQPNNLVLDGNVHVRKRGISDVSEMDINDMMDVYHYSDDVRQTIKDEKLLSPGLLLSLIHI